MNEIIVSDKIENMIYEIRGKQVMLDSDLAKLYQCKNGTKSINLAVKRNINRFPEDFCFQLTNIEFNNLKFQIETSSSNNYGGVRKLPYVFTEQGVAMLASVLRTNIAAEENVNIMRAFVNMRRYLASNLIEQKYINNLVIKNDERLSVVENTLDKLNEKEKVNTIFFQGQIFDAYSLLMDILSKAKNEIIIIDDYAGSNLLKILKDIDKKIIVVSKNLNEVSIKKYKSQYHNVEFISSDKFHDRFIILDREILYHSGASFKDLGTKCFAINKIEDTEYLTKIIKEVIT